MKGNLGWFNPWRNPKKYHCEYFAGRIPGEITAKIFLEKPLNSPWRIFLEIYLQESIKGISQMDLGSDSPKVIHGQILRVLSDKIPGG